MSKIYLYTFFRRLWCFLIVFILGLGLQPEVWGQSPSNQRYVSLMLLNLSNHGGPERNLINMAHDYGLNTVYLTVHWDQVYYDSPDKADWSRYDEQIKMVVDRGMYLALRIYLGRPKNRLNGFWDWEKDGLKDHKKISHMGAFTTSTFRYSHEPTVAKAANFVKEVLTRYKWVHDQGKLVFVATANTAEQEAGFPTSNFEPDTNHPEIYPTVFDCSDQTVEEYRQWLKDHYKKIERLNYAWGVTMKSFDEAEPYVVPWEPKESFKRRYGKDWYKFRHEQLRKYTETLIDAVKSVSPTIRYVSDYGAVWDEISGLRGTIAFHDLNRKADGVKVNDDVYWDHRYTTDVLRSGMPEGAFIGNEVFLNTDHPAAEIDRQVNECFEHGADFVCFVASLESVMRRFEPSIRAASGWKRVPKTKINYADSISYSLIRAIDAKSVSELVYPAYQQRAYKDPKNPKPVRIRLDDDMFVPSYWDIAANRNPVLKTPIPMQIKAIGVPFTIEIPKDHFMDPDGQVVSIEIPNLPSWLSFDGTQLKGTGTVLGDTRLEIKAIDDEGGTFSAFMTLRIDPSENTNIPPLLQLHLSELVARVNEDYSYPLPEEMFTDTDGQIVRVEASDLPPWLKFSNGEFSGTPSEVGDYRVTLKAYDNQNAFVETYITISVKDQSFFNTAPIVSKPIPMQFSPENQEYIFDIPGDTFVDPDGYITNLILHAHPTWLSLSFNRISGVPPGKGEYKFVVRAFDNNGSFVDAPVILRIEEASLRFTLQGAGSIDPPVIDLIERGKVYSLDSLPDRLNILAEGNYHFDRIVFKLKGPFVYESRTRRPPYTLYYGEGGFKKAIGRYDIYAEAYTWDDSLLYVTSTHFYITRGDSLNLTGDMPEWTAFPMPFNDVLNLKTEDENPTPYQFTLYTVDGRKLEIPQRVVVQTGSLYQINFTDLGLTSGVYIVHAHRDGAVRRTIKVVKK